MNLLRTVLAILVILGELKLLDWFLYLNNLSSNLAVFAGITGIVLSSGLTYYIVKFLFRRKA